MASYHLTRSVFLRLLAVTYLFAFLSLHVQIPGLIGVHGILPAGDFLREVAAGAGAERYWMLPTLAWINSGDVFLRSLSLTGAVLSLAAAAGVLRAPLFAALWVLYLSLVVVGQDFLSFQWDALLLEAGFLAILFAGPSRKEPSRIVLWLYWILLFRLMFSSGVVKLASGDPTWRDLTALDYHFETQPLPNPVAWFAQNTPSWGHKLATTVMFAIELGAPFLLFASRQLRMVGAGLIALFQTAILLSGNYAFFNLLTLALCVPALDDRTLGRVFSAAPQQIKPEHRVKRVLVAVIAAPILIAGAVQIAGTLGALNHMPGLAVQTFRWLGHFHIVNSYGLFAVMTTTRPEIIVEGSNDGQNWQAYEFKYKPGDLKRAPPIVAPHQPRLDWQMWFAALENYRSNPWFVNFMLRLLEGSPDVLHLLVRNPFTGAPPRYVRAEVYEYHFTDFRTLRHEGAWWRRKYLGSYFPAASLRSP